MSRAYVRLMGLAVSRGGGTYMIPQITAYVCMLLLTRFGTVGLLTDWNEATVQQLWHRTKSQSPATSDQ